jgi:hypothetical protein
MTGVSVAQRTQEVVAILAPSAVDRGPPSAGFSAPCVASATVRALFSRNLAARARKLWTRRPDQGQNLAVFRPTRRCPDLIFDICDQVTVLNLGRMPAAASPAEIRIHKEVVSACLGG